MKHIKDQLLEAQKVLSAYWPLTSFIASNHLWHLREHNFFSLQNIIPLDYLPEHDQPNIDMRQNISSASIGLYAEQIYEFQFKKLDEYISDKIFIILNTYYTQENDKSLIESWASFDKKNAKNIYKLANTTTEISKLTSTLGIPEKYLSQYFQKIYLKIYGWASFSKWLLENPNNPWIIKSSILDEIVLMWLFYENIAHKNTNIAYSPKENGNIKRNVTLKNHQYDLEKTYWQPIKNQIKTSVTKKTTQIDAQFVFCIDTRSEGLRRQIESTGCYETFGCAGFFGVIFKLIKNNSCKLQSPAIIKPTKIAYENSGDNSPFATAQNTLKAILDNLKNQSIASLALFEIVGIWHSFYMLLKSISPKLWLKKANNKYIPLTNNYSDPEKVEASANFLKSIGLVSNFSKTVIICGHQTDVCNNPFESSLNCGACGGNSGDANTLLICGFLNDSNIREKLRIDNNISISPETQFLPAMHHTVNDRVEFLGEMPNKKILTDIDQACLKLRKEKTADYPFLYNLSKNETNWSELIPELGLLNNASFIIGPRDISKHINLKRRTFLQSYNPSTDINSEILSGIFSGPCIVAHWINMQYFLSSTNPSVFGAGNKAIHNVIPNIGVMEGNLSDLKIGLPIQSTHFQNIALHTPLRLTYFVYASENQINKALENSPDFYLLVKNEWVNLIPIRPA